MCGIFVWLERHKPVDVSAAANALMTMYHRGPDAQRLTVIAPHHRTTLSAGAAQAGAPGPEQARLVLGHARLSIIDLSEGGAQPMAASDGATLVFNGTIYNYPELRAELSAKGQTFASASDTEVLLHWLRTHDSSRMTDLNGNWATAFLNTDGDTLTLSRDPYGERPLFWWSDGETFLAASEIKAIYRALGEPIRPMGRNALAAFVCYQNWPTGIVGRTLYTDIQAVPPGVSLSVNLNSLSILIKETHTLPHYIGETPRPEAITADLENACRLRLRADVPIGITVSGGVDSSSIAGFIHSTGSNLEGTTFYTARYDVGTNEDYEYATGLAKKLGISLCEVPIPYDTSALNRIIALGRHYDQPSPCAGSTISDNLMCQAAAEDGKRVLINGTGGDEVFGGYGNEYIEGAINELLTQRSPLETLRLVRETLGKGWTSREALASLAMRKLRGGNRPNSLHRFLMFHARNDFAEHLAAVAATHWATHSHQDDLRDVQLADCTKGRLVNYLAFSDLNAMSHSLEGRSPMLDPNLIRYIGLPVRDKYSKGFNKYALRKAISPIVGPAVAWRSAKQGFTYPFSDFLRNNEEQILAIIRDSNLIADLFRIESLLTDIAQTPWRRDIVLALFSLAAFTNHTPCRVA